MSKKIVVLFLACGLIFATGCGKKTTNDDKKTNDGKDDTNVVTPIANTEDGIIDEQVIDGLKLTNVTLISEGDHSVFTVDIINTTDQVVNVNSFNLIFKDKDGNEMANSLLYVGKSIEPNGRVPLLTNAEINLSNAKFVEYVRNY